jgi:hypothetical protein
LVLNLPCWPGQLLLWLQELLLLLQVSQEVH